jgi:hypothetical protein
MLATPPATRLTPVNRKSLRHSWMLLNEGDVVGRDTVVVFVGYLSAPHSPAGDLCARVMVDEIVLDGLLVHLLEPNGAVVPAAASYQRFGGNGCSRHRLSR